MLTGIKLLAWRFFFCYNYTYNNFNSLTNTCSLDSERQKALDFIYAYKYAVENFSKLDNVSSLDIAFFYEDYTKRLRGKYESLPEELKIELADAFQVWRGNSPLFI